MGFEWNSLSRSNWGQLSENSMSSRECCLVVYVPLFLIFLVDFFSSNIVAFFCNKNVLGGSTFHLMEIKFPRIMMICIVWACMYGDWKV